MTSFELTLPDWVSFTNPTLLVMLLPAAMVVLLVLGLVSRWMLLASIGSIISAFRVGFAAYQMFRIVLDLALLSTLKVVARIRALKVQWSTTPTSGLRQQLLEAKSYEEYKEIAEEIDNKEGNTVWKYTDDGFFQQKILQQTTESLRNARQAGDFRQLKFLVAGLMKRNHLGIEDSHLHNRCLQGTKISIEVCHFRRNCLYDVCAHSIPWCITKTTLDFLGGSRRKLALSSGSSRYSHEVRNLFM